MRLLEIVYNHDFEYAEVQGAGVALVWGIWLMLFPQASPGSVCVSEVLSNAAPWPIPGFISMCVGLLQLWALGSRNFEWRRKGAMAAVMLWAGMGTAVALQNYKLPPVPLLFAFSIGAAWSYWRMLPSMPFRK